MRCLHLAGLLALSLSASAQSPVTAQYDDWRAHIRRALFIDEKPPALDPARYSVTNLTPDIRIERVSFTTQFGMRVPAIVYVPRQRHGRAPAMVIVPGHGGDKTSWYAIYAGLMYARAGAIVLTYDPIGEDERNASRLSETRAHDAPVPGLRHPERFGGLMIEDVLQSLRYLAQRKDIDPNRIAVLGYSMGTLHAAIAAAISTTPVRALVLSAGGNLDGPGQYWDSGNKLNCQAAPYQALSFLGDRGVALYALRALAGPTLVINGDQDGLITKFNEHEAWFEELRERLATATATRSNLPVTVFSPEAGHRPAWVTREAALWLNAQLSFPQWTDDFIRRLPTTTAHAWAFQHHVAIAGAYDNPLQEGGVPVLDLQLPGISRSQLQSVPENIWQTHSDDFLLEAWAAHALTAERSSN